MWSSEFENADNYMRESLRLKMGSGRFSSVLVRQLITAFESRTINTHTVLDEIGALEGVGGKTSRTKPPTQFRGDLLGGLWHKHFFEAANMMTNIRNRWGRRPLNELIKSVQADKSLSLYEMTNRIVHQVVLGGYEDRARRQELTGEWIVYARQGDRNTYLTLGRHGADQVVLESVRLCQAEFPDLVLP